MNENSPLHGCAAWWLAARPRTLFASASPVLAGCVLAARDGCFKCMPALLCLLVAMLAQVASNFANDYFDFRKGADRDDRLGPARAVASGWIRPQAMLRGTWLMLGLSCLFGCALIYYGGWILLPVGIAMALCVLAYSAGPFPLAYNGLGDVCVLLFYGVVPVCFTYYVQAGAFSLLAFLISLAVGLLSVNILVVNNYRDFEQDSLSHKRTSIVLLGRRFGRGIYLVNGLLALLIALPVVVQNKEWAIVLLVAFFGYFFLTWRRFCRLAGPALNAILGQTSMLVFLYVVVLAVALL